VAWFQPDLMAKLRHAICAIRQMWLVDGCAVKTAGNTLSNTWLEVVLVDEL
jgi:hypothetical protein